MEKLTTDDKKVTFVEGKSYLFKYKRTQIFHIWEPKHEWYRVERVTSKGYDVSGYVIFSQMTTRYDYYMQDSISGKKLQVSEVSAAVIKEHNSKYVNWEEIQKQERKSKYKRK